MIKILFKAIYYQVLISFRIKQAIFFSVVFPVFIFLIFGTIWGTDNTTYVKFLLSGIIGMTILSDGLFAIGPVVKTYYSSGLIKYLRKLPFNIIIHFTGLVISRIITLIFVIILLCLSSYLIFHTPVSLHDLSYYLLGVTAGLFVFSFLGLTITFAGIKQEPNVGIINLIYFTLLFTGNTFFPVSDYSKTIGFIGNLLPFNGILAIIRAENFNYLIFLFWLIAPVVAFYFLFNKVKFAR